MDVANRCLDGNADAVEFCPHYPFHHILAAATYTLEEGVEAKRAGKLSLFSADQQNGLDLQFQVETAGIFDIKWNPPKAGSLPVLAQADADGCVTLYSLQSESIADCNGAGLVTSCSADVSSMCLCVDWSPRADNLSIGQSDGSLSVASVREAELQVLQSWAAHQYEVWTCSFDLSAPYMVYSGADDCCFSCWDIRDSTSNMVFQSTKSHKMGVCCIVPSSWNSNMILTGSYDEFIRVWDLRVPSRPIMEKSLCLGGGVWRIKFHPDVPDVVLAACMHNGFAIVNVGDGDMDVRETYKKHESLAYGADWQRGANKNKALVATCSFYDRCLRLWQPECMGN